MKTLLENERDAYGLRLEKIEEYDNYIALHFGDSVLVFQADAYSDGTVCYNIVEDEGATYDMYILGVATQEESDEYFRKKRDQDELRERQQYERLKKKFESQ